MREKQRKRGIIGRRDGEGPGAAWEKGKEWRKGGTEENVLSKAHCILCRFVCFFRRQGAPDVRHV